MSHLADRMYEAAMAAADSEGRLPLPAYVAWDTCPFEGDMRVKPLMPPRLPEEPRWGEGGKPCGACETPRPARWTDGTWRLTSFAEPSGLPLLLTLEPVEHLDLADLDPDQAAGLGRLTVAIVAAMERLPGVKRTHVVRWGDGSAHLHVMFQGRPEGLPQVRGSFVTIWDDILPPFPTDEWEANAERVCIDLQASVGGRVSE